jgi:hypothetical protein
VGKVPIQTYFSFFILVLNINWHGEGAWLIYIIMKRSGEMFSEKIMSPSCSHLSPVGEWGAMR